MYPRLEGSDGEKEAIAAIISVLSDAGIEYEIVDFQQMERGHSFSRSIYASKAGAQKDEILFIVPINHPDDATKQADGAVNLAIICSLIKHLDEYILPVGVRFLFLGAEFGSSPYYPIGTNKFLTSFFPDFPLVVLYFDFDSLPERIIVRSGDKGYVSPYWFTDSCSNALDKAGLFYLVRGNENQFYRLNITENPAPLSPYLADDYPAISFNSSPASLRSDQQNQWAESFQSFFGNFFQLNAGGFSSDWDRHYLFFQVKTLSLIIEERIFVILMIGSLFLLMIYPLFFPFRFGGYARSLAKNGWAVPLLLALVFVLLLLGTLIVEGISTTRGFPDIWQYRPFFFFSLKICAAIFLFSLFYRFVFRIPFPRRGRFYNATALFLLFCDIVILAMLDISLSYYAIWAILWAFLFSLFRSRFLKALCLLISPLWYGKAIYDVFTLPALSVARELLLSRITGNLIIGFLMLPFLLMLIRLDFMFRHPRRRVKKLLITTIYAFLGVACAGLIAYLALYNPFGDGNPQPVEVTEVIHQNINEGYFVVSSPAPLRNIAVQSGQTSFDISTRSRIFRYDIETDAVPEGFEIESRSSTFLGRKRFLFTVDSRALPAEVYIRLDSNKEIIIYDANFPYSFIDPLSALIHIGRNPPLPLRFEFTVPENQTGNLTIELKIRRPATPLTVTGEQITVSRSMQVSDIIALSDVE